MPETRKCSICQKPIKGKNASDIMEKLWHHRKNHHHKAHRESVRKAIATRKRNRS